MIDEILSFKSDHMLIENIRACGYIIYTDLATDREIVFRHGHPIKARQIHPRITQRTLDFALQGKSGFFFDTFNEEEYTKFNELYDSLAQ